MSRFSVSVLAINPVQYDFPDGLISTVPLLKEQEPFYSPTFFLIPEETASENYFTPLGKCKSKGKRFRQDDPVSQQSLFAGSSSSADKIDGYRKSFTKEKPGSNLLRYKGPDIWDLIFPLLQPPIDGRFVDVLDLPPRCNPYAYQWEGIKFLVEREKALLGDDMGTGKTVQSALACRLLFQRGAIKKALILCPLSVLAQWDRELERWAPSLQTTVVRGLPSYREVCWRTPAHIWITTYDTLRQDIDHLAEKNRCQFDLVILDEAQKIKNPSSGVSQAVRRLDAQYRWALSGTPIENDISDLRSIFSFLKPGLFSGHTISANHASEIIAPYFLRRRREDVLEDLPDKEEFKTWLRLKEEQQKTYNDMERERVVKLHEKGAEITAQNILSLINELKKICNRDPVTNASAKLDWLRENIPDICESGDKVLIFSQYKGNQFGGTKWLAEELAAFGSLNYSEATTDRQRQEMLHQFENNPEKCIFLGHPKTAGLGLNQLVVANYVVHFDHWWNPAVAEQATARVHRPNQTKKVFVYHLWVEDTIENLILEKTLAKKQLYDEVIDSLSTEASKELLFDIYDGLLVKYGFEPRLKKDHEQKRAPQGDYGSPRQFEELISRLFSKMGFHTRVTPSSRDGGVDVIASREIGGGSVEKIAIQCKQQANPVGSPVLRDLLGVLGADSTYSSGIVVTNATASRDALDMIRENGRLQIIIGEDLNHLLHEYNVR